MASKIANKVAKRYFAGHVARYEPEDPYYETYVDGKGRSRRRKRALPAGLTAGQAKLLRKIKRRAHYLDKGFTVCGFRFGWTFVIGLVPGLGDAVNALLGYGLVIRPATRGEELPAATVKRMVFNSAVSAGVGLVPLVGDVAVAAWKANSRNAHLFEAYLVVKGEENMAAGLPDLTPRVTVNVNNTPAPQAQPEPEPQQPAAAAAAAAAERKGSGSFWSRNKA